MAGSATRSHTKKFYVFTALIAVLAVWFAAAWLHTGGIDRGFSENPDYQWAEALPGVSCQRKTIPVRLSESGLRQYHLVGELCQPGTAGRTTLQVLVSGSGYGMAYWDFPYHPDTYSYARAALRNGDTVFNFDRLGMGLSDHPFGASLDVDTQAYVLHQVVRALTAETDFAAVVLLGHSFGSTISLAHALRWPQEVDGIVLTGFIHNFNPAFGAAMGKSISIAAFSGPLAGDLLDPTYTISKNNTRGDVFYTASNVDNGVIATDNATRETTAVGELISMSRYFADQSTKLRVPVLVMVGENDFVVCGNELDCNDHDAVIRHELNYYPEIACPEIVVVDDTNHNINLHRNAPDSFAVMLDWVARRIGTAGRPPTEPCQPTDITQAMQTP